jgi:pilus assembly protein CpaE
VAPVDPGSGESVSPSLVTRIIDLLRAQFDYVVVDTPPAFDEQVLAAFDASDVIALIATLDVPALKNLKLTLETLDLLQYQREKWRVVLNRADSKVGLSLNEVEKTLRTEISAHVPSSRDVPAAINRGVPIMLDDPKHPVSISIRQFGERHVVSLKTAGAKDRAIPAELRNDRRSLIRKRRPRTV